MNVVISFSWHIHLYNKIIDPSQSLLVLFNMIHIKDLIKNWFGVVLLWPYNFLILNIKQLQISHYIVFCLHIFSFCYIMVIIIVKIAPLNSLFVIGAGFFPAPLLHSPLLHSPPWKMCASPWKSILFHQCETSVGSLYQISSTRYTEFKLDIIAFFHVKYCLDNFGQTGRTPKHVKTHDCLLIRSEA